MFSLFFSVKTSVDKNTNRRQNKSPAIYYKSIKVESPAEPRRVVVQVEDQGILSRLFAQIKSYFNQKWACDNYFERKRGVVRNFVIEGMACQPP